MKHGNILIGGAYFSDERLGFFDTDEHKANENRLKISTLKWEDVMEVNKVDIPDADFNVIFGLKTWTRKLRKRRLNGKERVQRIEGFLDKNFDKKTPMAVLDDLNLEDEIDMGDRFRKTLFEKYNCKFMLLREFLSNKNYGDKVYPFSICCDDNTHLAKKAEDKKIDIYFRGDSSNDDRGKYLQHLKNMKYNVDIVLYEGGEKSGKKLPREEFLKNLADSKLCPTFAGHGYCCFRYQEAACVGSIPVIPKYPFVVRNDYEDMTSCIKFKNVDDMKNKINKVLGKIDVVNEMQNNALENFKKYHTTAARYNQFLNHIDEEL